MELHHLAYIGLAITARCVDQISVSSAAKVLVGLCPAVVMRYGAQADMSRMCNVSLRLTAAEEGAEAAFLMALDAYLGKRSGAIPAV